MGKRVFLIVLDSLGIGEMPDAALFGDTGSNTLRSIRSHSDFHCPNLASLGLFSIDGVEDGTVGGGGSFARMRERSMGKDTTVGHWEIMGVVSAHPLPTYPEGFPAEVLDAFRARTGREVLCNRPYSGTEVLRDYGREQLASGALIVYTSADSVFQVAAHTDSVPVETLYGYCREARELLCGEHAVGRVIARPFTGEYPYTRVHRHDFSLAPPKNTVLDVLCAHGFATVGVGKIGDIFASRGVRESYPTASNEEGMARTLAIARDRDFEGLCFVNLVEFDSTWGHRNDVGGYARGLSAFDAWLGTFLPVLGKEDICIITADHGCDPATPSTDHSREYTPMLIFGDGIRKGVNLGTRESFADIGETVLEIFGITDGGTAGKSFYGDVGKECS